MGLMLLKDQWGYVTKAYEESRQSCTTVNCNILEGTNYEEERPCMVPKGRHFPLP